MATHTEEALKRMSRVAVDGIRGESPDRPSKLDCFQHVVHLVLLSENGFLVEATEIIPPLNPASAGGE